MEITSVHHFVISPAHILMFGEIYSVLDMHAHTF